MGMDAKAYLWFGTTKVDGGFPEDTVELDRTQEEESEDAEETEYRAIEKFEKKVQEAGFDFVHIPSNGDACYAIAVKGTLQDYDWDCESKAFEMPQPTVEDAQRLVAYCKSIGWPTEEDSGEVMVGWRLGATYY
jgi:hypothetical protein